MDAAGSDDDGDLERRIRKIKESCPDLIGVAICEYANTVKAPNFGPHGNFGPLFQKGLLSLKRVLQKNEGNKSCRKL
jgi:hypothetical protein